MEQAVLALKQMLQKIGIPQVEIDKIISSIIHLVRKGCELSEKLTQQLDACIARKQKLDNIVEKTTEQQQELVELQKKIEKLQRSKNSKETSLGILASSLSMSIARIGIGTQAEEAIQQLLKLFNLPDLQYGVIASQVVGKLLEAIVHLVKNNHDVVFKENMKYYIATYEKSEGGWLFGQHSTGKIYVRLDTPNSYGSMDVVHRELWLKNAYPSKDVRIQLAQIIAGEFELGPYNRATMRYTFFGGVEYCEQLG